MKDFSDLTLKTKLITMLTIFFISANFWFNNTIVEELIEANFLFENCCSIFLIDGILAAPERSL